MSDRRRDESRDIKKDQQVRREVLDEIGAEIAQNHIGAHYCNPNRDQARGDWDRSRRHTDEGLSRDAIRPRSTSDVNSTRGQVRVAGP